MNDYSIDTCIILRVLALSWPSNQCSQLLRYAAVTGYKEYDSIVTHSYGVAYCGVSKAVSGATLSATLPTQVGWAQHVMLTARQQEVERQRCR